MVNYSYFFTIHIKWGPTSKLLLRAWTFRGPEGDQVLFAGQSRREWECVSQRKYCSAVIFFSRRDRNAPRLQWGERRSATDFQAKWWQLMLLFISLGQTFLLPQLTRCEHTHVVWWVPYPSKWTHLHMQCTVSVSPPPPLASTPPCSVRVSNPHYILSLLYTI